MGVSASLKAIHDDDLFRILANPNLVVPFIFGISPETEEPVKRSLFDRFFSSDDSPTEAKFQETPNVSLAGHWEIMTFVLSGPNPPEDNVLDLVEGNFATCTEVDLGYGPPRIVPVSRMTEFNRAIAVLPDEQIIGRLNESELLEAGIYGMDRILADLVEWKAAVALKASELRTFAKYCDERQVAALVYFH